MRYGGSRQDDANGDQRHAPRYVADLAGHDDEATGCAFQVAAGSLCPSLVDLVAPTPATAHPTTTTSTAPNGKSSTVAVASSACEDPDFLEPARNKAADPAKAKYTAALTRSPRSVACMPTTIPNGSCPRIRM